MNRYLITNSRNGMLFQRTGETPPPREPEYGPPAGKKLKVDCDRWELEHGKSAGIDDFGQELWEFPDSMQVQVFDMTAELAAAEAKKQERRARHQRLLAANTNAVPAAFRGLIQDLIDEIKELRGLVS